MKRSRALLAFFIFWAMFTMALLTWWVIFSFRQLKSIQSLNLASDSQILRHQKMLIYEGLTLYACLIIGAVALVYFIVKENRILRERKNFLSLFTHDLKTTISSLRLMLERLSSKVEDPLLKTEVKEIQGIGTRLNQQLGNSLQVSFEEGSEFVFEEIDFCMQINFIRSIWSDLSFKVDDGILVWADSSALRSITTNLIQNAVDHARADEVDFTRLNDRKGFVGIQCSTPDGRKLPVSIESFRKNFRAFQSIDGSGVGLKLTQKIMNRIGGDVKFDLDSKGALTVALYFKAVQKGAL